MINDSEEKQIIEQLRSVDKELKMILANLNILSNYFEILINSYEDKKYLK